MSDRKHPYDQLATVSAGSVLNADIADVGRYRERARMQRLWRLSMFVGLPTLFLWFRIIEHKPFNVFALPHLNLTIVASSSSPCCYSSAWSSCTRATVARRTLSCGPSRSTSACLMSLASTSSRPKSFARSTFSLHTRHFRVRWAAGRGAACSSTGRPGTGKTHTAKALAAEANVPFLFATATSFQSSMQGATQRKIRAYFKALCASSPAKRAARSASSTSSTRSVDRAQGDVASTPSRQRSTGCRCRAVGSKASPGLVSPPTQQTQFVGSGDLGMAVNELLVQLQSFDQPIRQRAALRQAHRRGKPVAAGDAPTEEGAGQVVEHHADRVDQPGRLPRPRTDAPGSIRPAADVRPARQVTAVAS